MIKYHAFLGILLMLSTPISEQAQQWSSDPVVDRMKANEAAILKFQELTDYCKINHWEPKCDGISGNPPSTFMSYEDALELGKQQQANADEAKKANTPAELAVILARQKAQAARETDILQKIEQGVRDLCAKQPDVKSCKTGQTPDQIAQQVFKNDPGLQAYVKDGKLPPQKEKPNTTDK